MSAASQDVLLDSNAYFRLGNSVRPLLQQSFGSSPCYSLHILAELDDEYASNIRLQHKFEWVIQAEYRADRKARRYELRGDDKAKALTAFSYLDAYATEQGINLSREDLKALAAGLVKGIPIVSDDRGMAMVAEANGIDCWSTLHLLHVMLEGGRIDLDTVTQIIEYWEYEKDLPMALPRLQKLFQELFGEECPI